jgi:acyl-CoA synthetase (AMP-forming)/AMP-acid ligase II
MFPRDFLAFIDLCQVREVIGAFAASDEIHWAPGLPKTRSGKIMRRVLRKLALPDYQTQVAGDGMWMGWGDSYQLSGDGNH